MKKKGPIDSANLVKEARGLPAPKKAPRPMKRVRLSDEFDVVCRNSEDVGLRYFVRYNRDPIVMCGDWQQLMEHMQWAPKK